MIINGRNYPDILFPKGEFVNRDEVFVVDFDDIMQSQCENIALGLLQLEEYQEDFPLLRTMISNEDSLITYFNTAPFDKYDFLQYIANRELEKSYMDEVCNKAFSIDTYEYQHAPMMAYGIQELAEMDYLKKITFAFHRPIYPHDIEYLEANFEKYIDKVYISEDSLLTLAAEDYEKKEITTYFTADIDSIYQIATESDKYNIAKVAIILCNTSKNMNLKIDTAQQQINTEERKNEDFASLVELHQFSFSRYNPEPYTEMYPVTTEVNIPFADENHE